MVWGMGRTKVAKPQKFKGWMKYRRLCRRQSSAEGKDDATKEAESRVRQTFQALFITARVDINAANRLRKYGKR